MQRRYAVRTPLGRLTARFTERGLAGLSLPGGRGPDGLPELLDQEGARGRALVKELGLFFSAARRGRVRFTGPLDLSAGSEFERDVWRALRRIPPGEVRTYGEVARAIGRPRAARAVGGACGRNPVALVVPCHRVVGAKGPGGFGAGLGMKERLLRMEGVRA
jgi:methylated-DNA-[protein]-cysteine S-methyltransferase